jgi:NADPH-dependent ferric siderophore reductase
MSTSADRMTRRVRHETKLRLLTVRRVQTLTPGMRRITLGGEALADFISAAADDHVKVFFPRAPGELPILPSGPPGSAAMPGTQHADAPAPIGRDYTPRRYTRAALELELDFVLHGEGPAATWAAQAAAGQQLGVGGPRGSFIIPNDFDWYVLIGDETALPAIGRRLEELAPPARAIVIAEVACADEELPLTSAATLAVRWLHRGSAEPGDASQLLAAARELQLPEGAGFIWIAGESNVSKALREYFVEQRGVDKAWIKAAGYWKRGAVATHETHN